jgi:hypothetical protein
LCGAFDCKSAAIRFRPADFEGLTASEKRRRVEAFIVGMDDLKDQPLMDAPMCNVKVKGNGGCRFQIRSNNRFHVVNTSDGEALFFKGVQLTLSDPARNAFGSLVFCTLSSLDYSEVSPLSSSVSN